ncbi:hypothetical protein Tco_0167787, partial [Tanacetum coccineum]
MPGHLAGKVGLIICAEDEKSLYMGNVRFKLIILGRNVKHRILQNVDPRATTTQGKSIHSPHAPEFLEEILTLVTLTKPHWQSLKRVFRDLIGGLLFGIRTRVFMIHMRSVYGGEFVGVPVPILRFEDEFVANLSTHTPEPSRRFNFTCYDDDDDDEEITMPLSEIISQLPLSIVITTSPPVLPIEDPEDSPIMGNEELSTIPEKESDKFIKSSVEDLVPILSESEDTSGSNSKCDLHSCDDFSPINIPEGKSVTFSNPLFDSNEDFTSSDDESLSDEDVPEDKVKIYLNPLFEFDDEYISSDINLLFDEVLENIESKESYVSNLDDPALLVTHFSDANEDECFDSGGEIDEIDAFLDMDISTDIEDGY